MYEKIKKLIPNKLAKKNEKLLRSIMSIAYIGNKYSCNICDFKMSHFIQLENKDELCPKCGSLGRTRRLWSLLEDKVKGKKILHFSPSKSIKAKLASLKDIEYITSDYAGEFNAQKKLNIKAIDEPNDEFDIIICYHILEHIDEDIQAMKELKRILKPGGISFIQTPFKEGEIYEDESVKTEEDRLFHFGQKDHLRIYSIDGLDDRLKGVGFETELLRFNEVNNKGYKKNETIIIAKK